MVSSTGKRLSWSVAGLDLRSRNRAIQGRASISHPFIHSYASGSAGGMH